MRFTCANEGVQGIPLNCILLGARYLHKSSMLDQRFIGYTAPSRIAQRPSPAPQNFKKVLKNDQKELHKLWSRVISKPATEKERLRKEIEERKRFSFSYQKTIF